MDNILDTADGANHNADTDLDRDGTFTVTCPSCGDIGAHVDYTAAAAHADHHTTGDDANGLEAA